MRKKGFDFIRIFYVLAIIFCSTASYGQQEFTPVDIQSLNEDELSAFHELTQQKVSEFETYLTTISNKDRAFEEKELATLQALKLFTPEASIQISYKKNGKTTKVATRTIKEYLRRLTALPYAKVEVTFYQIAYVSGFIKGPDAYYATATIFQEFKAWDAEGNLVISDIDKKTINIKLEYTFNEYFDEWRWTVLLDDIKVLDMKS